MNDQFFIIYNDSQYNKFMNYLKNGDLQKVIYPFYYFYSYDLLIINKFFIDKLLAETDEDILTKYTKCMKLNILLYYIFKYKKINSINLFQFGYLDLHYKDVLYVLFREYFYLNEKHDIDKVTNYVNENTFISYIYGLFGRDINVINFILNKYENIKNRICENFLRVPLNLSLNLKKEYSKKLFKPNTLHFINDNKEYEDFVNLVFSDNGLYKVSLPVFDKENYFNKYNIDISHIKKENILNFKNFKPTYSPSCYSIDFFFNNLDLFKYNFNINHEPSIIIDLNMYKRDDYDFYNEVYDSENETFNSETSYDSNEPYDSEEEKYKKDPINYIINYEYDTHHYTYDNLIDKHSCILFYAFFLSTREQIDKILIIY